MTDIQITDVTNGSVQTDLSSGSQTWLGTRVFDKLVEAVNKNIELQYMEGRITGPDYANAYLGSMQAVLAQAVQYVLQEKITEAQIADVLVGIALKEQQLINLQDELLTTAKQRLVMYKDIEFKDEQAAFFNLVSTDNNYFNNGESLAVFDKLRDLDFISSDLSKVLLIHKDLIESLSADIHYRFNAIILFDSLEQVIKKLRK
jgi:hypothetical protein